MLGGADNPNGELPSYITGANKTGSTANQNLNQPGAIPGAALHHLPPVPVSVLRDLTQLPDSVLQNPPPIPAWRSPLRKQNKSTIVRLRSFVCTADDAPENASI